MTSKRKRIRSTHRPTLHQVLHRLGYKTETYRHDLIRVFDSTGAIVCVGHSYEVWEWVRSRREAGAVS